MKEYHVYEDRFTSNYINMLKKQGTYEQYMKKLILKPGGIRPMKRPIEQAAANGHRAESMYSDKGSRKI